MHKQVSKFVVRALLLLLPFILILYYFEVKLGKVQNSYNKKRKDFESQLDSIELLVLGASQTLYGINPSYFSCHSFNLSNFSQTFYYDTQLTLKHLDRLKKVKCVMISVSYFSFWSQLSDGVEKWREYYYYHFWDVPNANINYIDPKNYSLFWLYGPRTSLMYLMNDSNLDLSSHLDRNGWLKADTIANNQNISDELGKQRGEFHDQLRFDFRFDENFKILDSFLKACNKRDIKVVFITPPTLPTYYKYIDLEVNKRNEGAVSKLCKKYNCKYFNYFKDSRFESIDFIDNDHMSFVGAEKFSVALDKEIIRKYVLGD